MLETKQIDGKDALNICRKMMDDHTSELEQEYRFELEEHMDSEIQLS